MRRLCTSSVERHCAVRDEPLNSVEVSRRPVSRGRTEELELGTSVRGQAMLARQAVQDRPQVAARTRMQHLGRCPLALTAAARRTLVGVHEGHEEERNVVLEGLRGSVCRLARISTDNATERAEVDLRDDVAVAILAVADAELLDVVGVLDVPA